MHALRTEMEQEMGRKKQRMMAEMREQTQREAIADCDSFEKQLDKMGVVLPQKRL